MRGEHDGEGGATAGRLGHGDRPAVGFEGLAHQAGGGYGLFLQGLAAQTGEGFTLGSVYVDLGKEAGRMEGDIRSYILRRVMPRTVSTIKLHFVTLVKNGGRNRKDRGEDPTGYA